MKKMKWLVVCALITMSLSGCGATKKQAVAVEQMLASYGGYCMVAEDVAGQMQQQAKNVDKNADGAIYTIKVNLPDFSYFSDEDLNLGVPKVDWNKPDLGRIEAGIESAMHDAVVEFLEENKAERHISVPLEVIVKKGDGGQWSAELTRHGVEWLDDEIDGMIAQLCDDSRAAQDIYGMVEIAAVRERLLEEAFDEPSFAAFSAITAIVPQGNGEYKIELSYPDPEGVYAKLEEQAVLEYSEPVFEEISIFLAPWDVNVEEYSAGGKLSGSFIVAGSAQSGFSIKDDDRAKFKVEAVCLQHEASASLRVNEAWRVQPQAKPGSSVIYGTSGGNKCIVNTSSDSGDYYLRFYAIPGSDLKEEGTLTLGVYITAGKQYSFNMESGNYKLIFGTGGEWYGLQYMFGPQGKYNQMDSVIESSNGYYNELTLYSVEGGNTGLSTVPFYVD